MRLELCKVNCQQQKQREEETEKENEERGNMMNEEEEKKTQTFMVLSGRVSLNKPMRAF